MIISEEQRLAVAELRRHLDSKVEPIVVEYRDRFIPKEQMVAIVRDLVPFGLIAAPFAEEQGGMGLEWETHLRLYEEVVYTSADVAGPILINAVGADLLLRHGSAAQVRRYIPGVLAGELMLCVCISEPDVGSDVSAVSTRARRDGDHFVINGEKTWITNGGYADLAVVTARTSDEPRAGLTHFLVDRTEHGFESREIHKIALNSQSTAQLFFTDVRVPAENMLGNEGDGLRNTLQVFGGPAARGHVGPGHRPPRHG
jgi:alkylation response protein AidB-like acyl-CoA dehydrogenase